MRLLPNSFAEIALNARWAFEIRLEFIEAVALDPQAFEDGAPDLEEAQHQLQLALQLRDSKAEDAAMVALIHAEVVEWWRQFSKGDLLKELFERARQRSANSGSRDSRRRPSHEEGLWIVTALKAGEPDTNQLDAAWEEAAVAAALASHYLPPFGGGSPIVLRDLIYWSNSSRAHFDALRFIYHELRDQGERIPPELSRWWQRLAAGRKRRPRKKPGRRGHPVILANLPRDLWIIFVLVLLKRLGKPPMGTSDSGSRIVADVLHYCEETVREIWKTRVWLQKFVGELDKHARAIAERQGLNHTSHQA